MPVTQQCGSEGGGKGMQPHKDSSSFPFVVPSSSRYLEWSPFNRQMKKEKKTSGQDGGIGCHLVVQSQQKLQLNYKTTITQNHQKIELYGSLTTKELKKSHSSKQVGGVEMRRCGDMEQWSHTHVWWIKISYISGARDCSPTPDHPTYGSSACREDKSP